MRKDFKPTKKYNMLQKLEIILGVLQNVDVSVYMNPEFKWVHMSLIRSDLKDGVNVSYYTSLDDNGRPVYDIYQMTMISLGMARGVDVSVYANPIFDKLQMSEILVGLQEGVDVSIFAKPEFSTVQMFEIREGLRKNIDVSVYAKPEYNRDEMRRIRRSLE